MLFRRLSSTANKSFEAFEVNGKLDRVTRQRPVSLLGTVDSAAGDEFQIANPGEKTSVFSRKPVQLVAVSKYTRRYDNTRLITACIQP